MKRWLEPLFFLQSLPRICWEGTGNRARTQSLSRIHGPGRGLCTSCKCRWRTNASCSWWSLSSAVEELWTGRPTLTLKWYKETADSRSMRRMNPEFAESDVISIRCCKPIRLLFLRILASLPAGERVWIKLCKTYFLSLLSRGSLNWTFPSWWETLEKLEVFIWKNTSNF